MLFRNAFAALSHYVKQIHPKQINKSKFKTKNYSSTFYLSISMLVLAMQFSRVIRSLKTEETRASGQLELLGFAYGIPRVLSLERR